MNLDKNSENIQILKTPQAEGILNKPAVSLTGLFKDEFDKMLLESVDASQFVQLAPLEILMQADENISLDTKSIEDVDAMFFFNISNTGETNLNLQIKDNENVIDAANYKTMPVSKTIGDILMKASENNKSVRLDFDNQVTVVLKVAKDGRIDATFFPQDKQVENYLRNNIDYLKVRFDEQNIAYANLSYKPYQKNKQSKEKKQ